MKRILIGVCSVVALFTLLVRCNEERITYSDGNFVMFSDTLIVLPIQNNTESFDITIASTNSVNQDRNFGIEIVDKKHKAMEDGHYSITSTTDTTKAGEDTYTVKKRGTYDQIGATDSLGLTIRLVSPNNSAWEAYDERWLESQIILRKACPFDINIFSGYVTLQSTFFDSYMQHVNLRLIKTEVNAEKNTVTFKNMFYKGSDITVGLKTDNPLTPDLYMDKDQQIGKTDEAFGTIYGNGKLMSYMPSAYLSYYSTCEEFMVQYMTFYVDGVGTVGTYVNILKWISDAEAEILKSQGVDY